MDKQPETIKIMLDFLQGPIWFSDYETGELNTGINTIDSDPILKELNCKCADLFSSYYEFDSHNQSCWFNSEREKADKEILLDLITSLIARLNEINDGTYIIEDFETERIKGL